MAHEPETITDDPKEALEGKGSEPEWANPKLSHWKLPEMHKNEVKPMHSMRACGPKP